MEFYLIRRPRAAELRGAPLARIGQARQQAEILAMRQLDAWDNFFTTLYDACEAMDFRPTRRSPRPGPGGSSRST